MEYTTLRNGVRMPMLGYSTFQIPAEDTKRCVLKALSVGYRSIDTAQGYFNEEGVGEALWRQTRRATYGSFLRGLNSLENIAVAMAERTFRGCDYFRFPEIFDTITKQDVERFIADYVTPDRATISIIHPKAES